MPRVLVCADEDFNDSTQTCDAETWVAQPAGWLPLPDLPAQDGAQIGLAIGGVWVVAWAWKQLGRVLDDSSKPQND